MSPPTSRKGEGVYYVVVDGVPQHCQWQELKDYLRDSAKVNPGYANVLKVNEDGTRVGFCPLRTKTDANKAYDFLVAEGWRGLDIRVSLILKADLRSEEIQRKRGPEQSRRRRMPNPTPALPSFTTNGPPSTRSVSAVPVAYNMTPMSQALDGMSYPASARTPRLAAGPYPQVLPGARQYMSMTQQEAAISNVSSPSSRHTSFSSSQHCGLPSHLRHLSGTDVEDLVCLHQQAIHVSRLPHDTLYRELQKFLSKVGPVSDISIKRGKEKRCSATAKYKTAQQATQAIDQLHGSKFKNMTITVRRDRSEAGSVSSAPSTTSRGSDSDSTTSRISSKQAVARSGPLVVNGARGPGYNKKQENDDDSDSQADTGIEATKPARHAPMSSRKTTSQKTRR